MGGKTQRSWLSIVATISLLATLAPGAAGQDMQDQDQDEWRAKHEAYGMSGCTVMEGFNDRCPSWLSWPRPKRSGIQDAMHLLESPDGGTVYLVGSDGPLDSRRPVVTAYVATGFAEGSIKWSTEIGSDTDEFRVSTPINAALSSDGKRLYVTGNAFVGGYMASLDTATGKVLWRKTLFELFARVKIGGPIAEQTIPHTIPQEMVPQGLVVSPDDRRLYISIATQDTPGETWYAALEMDGDEPAGDWIVSYENDGLSRPRDRRLENTMAVSSDGSRVFAQIDLRAPEVFNRGFATISINAHTGEITWDQVFLHNPSDGTQNQSWGLELSPDDSRVYVLGQHWFDFREDSRGVSLLFAYDATDGRLVWSEEYDATPGTGCEENGVSLQTIRRALDMSPSGDVLYFATGASYKYDGGSCFGGSHRVGTSVTAVRAATGKREWTRLFGRDGGYSCLYPQCDLRVVPGPEGDDDGSQLVVTTNYAPDWKNELYPWTLVLDAASGNRLWQSRHLDTFNDDDDPTTWSHLGVSTIGPESKRLYRTVLKQNPYRLNILAFDLQRDTTSDPDPTPTPTVAPTGEPTPTPTPSQSPAPDVTDVSFTERSRTSGQYSDETLFEARLADSGGDPIAGGELAFELTGAESARTFTATTDADGLASVTPTLEEKPGPYQLTVRYEGDGDHEPSADTASFVVDKEDSALDLSETKGKDKALVAHLYDADAPADGIAGKTIDFYAGAELLGSATTDQDGVAAFEPPKQKGKPQPYEARFEGDDFYLGSSDQAGKGGKGGGG